MFIIPTCLTLEGILLKAHVSKYGTQNLGCSLSFLRSELFWLEAQHSWQKLFLYQTDSLKTFWRPSSVSQRSPVLVPNSYEGGQREITK